MASKTVEYRLEREPARTRHTSALVGVFGGVPGHGLISKIEVLLGPGRRVVLTTVLLLGSFAELAVFVFAVQFRHSSWCL